MKQIIKLTENELHTLINESVKRVLSEGINELSPELLTHASDVADNKDRSRQYSVFKRGARDAWNRDYGFEDVDGAYDVGENTPAKYDFAMCGMNPIITKTKNDKFHQTGRVDDIEHMANNYLKPGHRNKVLKGLKSAENMRSGLDPQGNPYPTK